MEIDNFVRDHVFFHIPEKPGPDGYNELWWREVKGGGEGYILVWSNGDFHHTYHHPENTFGDSDPE